MRFWSVYGRLGCVSKPSESVELLFWRGSFDLVLFKFFPQSAAIYTEISRSFGLIMVTVIEHRLQHRLFNFGDDGIK